ncbi:hypothetical protein ACFL3Q_12355 [Planctomycetota bacterium]
MRKRTVKILKYIAIVLVVLSLIYAIAVGVSAAKLRRAYADLKNDNRPMKKADVIPPEVPDTENAALLYESAALLLKAQPAPEGNLQVYLGGLSDKFIKKTIEPDKLVELQQLIEQDVVTQALSIVEQGTQRRSYRFDHDYNAGINISRLNLSNLRRLTFILSAKARIEAQAGNLDNAWNMARIQMRLADALLTEPIIVPQLVRIAIIRMACKTIQELCAIAPPNEQQYRSVEDLLAGLDEIAPMVRAIDGERLLIGEWAFNLPKNELYKIIQGLDLSGIKRRFFIFLTSLKPLFLADRAAYMRYMHKSAQFFEDPNSHVQADLKEEERHEKLHMQTSILAPAIFRVKEIHCEMTAELRITRAGLALLQHKQGRDAFPDTLEALNLNDTDDPFSNEQLRYKTQGQGFILYSIGPDKKDNDGSPREKKQEKDWDIVWTYTGGR